MAQLTPAQQFGARFAQERRLLAVHERRDVDQDEIAKALGVSASAVSRWENGESIPKDSMLLLIGRYFGVTAAWLRYGQEPREAPPSQATTDGQAQRPPRMSGFTRNSASKTSGPKKRGA